MYTHIEFIPHNDENCSMGHALLRCPCCDNIIIDYNTLWTAFTGYGRLQTDIAKTKCDACEEEVTIKKIGYDQFIILQ